MPAKKQLSFDDEIYTQPVAAQAAAPAAAPKGKKSPRASGTTAPPAALQPFLPGLSRRGRPRSKNPVPPTVRASESRKRRMESGAKRIDLLLPAETAAELEKLAAHFKVARAEIIGRLIAKAAKRISGKQP